MALQSHISRAPRPATSTCVLNSEKVPSLSLGGHTTPTVWHLDWQAAACWLQYLRHAGGPQRKATPSPHLRLAAPLPIAAPPRPLRRLFAARRSGVRVQVARHACFFSAPFWLAHRLPNTGSRTACRAPVLQLPRFSDAVAPHQNVRAVCVLAGTQGLHVLLCPRTSFSRLPRRYGHPSI